jgi:hypothetical protein
VQTKGLRRPRRQRIAPQAWVWFRITGAARPGYTRPPRRAHPSPAPPPSLRPSVSASLPRSVPLSLRVSARRLSAIRPPASALRHPASGIALPPAARLTTFPTPPRANLHLFLSRDRGGLLQKTPQGLAPATTSYRKWQWGGIWHSDCILPPLLPGFGWGRSDPNPTHHQQPTHTQP